MQGVGNTTQANQTQNHPSENSRRPGTAGHPGKHLGQLKKAGLEPNAGHQPLIEQQLKSVQSGAKQETANSDTMFDIQLKHLQDTGDAFADQISFTSKTQAISTGFF